MDSVDFNQKRAAIAAHYRYDPLGFVENVWPWGSGVLDAPRVWQTVILDEIAQHLQDTKTRYDVCRIAVASGHGIGKSALTGMLVTWALACWRDPRVIVTANTEKQLLNKTSPEVAQWVRTSLYGDMFQCETMSIKYLPRPQQHRCDFETNTQHNAAAFAGLHAKGRLVMIIVDEASALSNVIYETILGAMTDEETCLIFVMLGNPTSAFGPFREAFRKQRKFWTTLNIDSRTVEGTNKKFLDQIIDEFGEDSDQAKTRVRGLFPSATENQFIPAPYIDAAYGRHLDPSQYEFAPVIISCDPAWSGDDLTVIGLRQGLKFEVLETLEKNTNDVALAQKIAHYETRKNADAVFIDAGYGTGVYSAGQSFGKDWRLVWFGEKAADPGYKNKRAEMYGLLRDWLMEGGSVQPVQRLYEDLTAIQAKPHPTGIVQLRSKNEMKKDGIPSTDYADALALTFAQPITKKLKQSIQPKETFAKVKTEKYTIGT